MHRQAKEKVMLKFSSSFKKERIIEQGEEKVG